jgi:hypothetical protein
MDQPTKRGRGRPRRTDAKTSAERQAIYLKARQRDMGEVAYALKDALAAKGTRTAFVAAYRGTPSGPRLRRGLARLLADDPKTMAFFDDLISSDDGK